MTKNAVIFVSVLTRPFDFLEGCSDTPDFSVASYNYLVHNFSANNNR